MFFLSKKRFIKHFVMYKKTWFWSIWSLCAQHNVAVWHYYISEFVNIVAGWQKWSIVSWKLWEKLLICEKCCFIKEMIHCVMYTLFLFEMMLQIKTSLLICQLNIYLYGAHSAFVSRNNAIINFLQYCSIKKL